MTKKWQKQHELAAIASMLETALFLAYGKQAQKTSGITEQQTKHTTWYFPFLENGGMTVSVGYQSPKGRLTMGAFFYSDGLDDILESFDHCGEFLCDVDHVSGEESPAGTVARTMEYIAKSLRRLSQCGIHVVGTV